MSQVDQETLKRKIKVWAVAEGLSVVQKKLMRAGCSHTFSYHMTKGTYVSELKEAALTRVLKAWNKR